MQINDALLGDLAAASDAGGTAAGIGAGAFRAPGVPGAAVPESGIGLSRVPRAYVSSKTAIGPAGAAAAAAAASGEGDSEGLPGNPYYTKDRTKHDKTESVDDGSSSGGGGGGGGGHPTPYP